jgi:hypothetical protein
MTNKELKLILKSVLVPEFLNPNKTLNDFRSLNKKFLRDVVNFCKTTDKPRTTGNLESYDSAKDCKCYCAIGLVMHEKGYVVDINSKSPLFRSYLKSGEELDYQWYEKFYKFHDAFNARRFGEKRYTFKEFGEIVEALLKTRSTTANLLK